ncbi:hypothetical protein JOB18_017536 [Solea senegalensis]|uniref:Uncharacterized protein n=1 Tax=Solea senegalensis TaxID=28829 RepID=A0AAV6SKB5_SOLSE|nr:hypothetical protein JOB18_017536 [Solea senegalensis]
MQILQRLRLRPEPAEEPPADLTLLVCCPQTPGRSDTVRAAAATGPRSPPVSPLLLPPLQHLQPRRRRTDTTAAVHGCLPQVESTRHCAAFTHNPRLF